MDASMGSPGGGGPVGGGGSLAAIGRGNSKHSPEATILTIWGRIIGFKCTNFFELPKQMP